MSSRYDHDYTDSYDYSSNFEAWFSKHADGKLVSHTISGTLITAQVDMGDGVDTHLFEISDLEATDVYGDHTERWLEFEFLGAVEIAGGV